MPSPLFSAAVTTAVVPLLASLASAQTSGAFDLVTYNVAGLPAWLNDNEVPGDKGTNSNTIGSVFAAQGYDVIHVQEDFAFHAYIYETDDHAYRTPTSGTVVFGDGLNTLANYNWTGFDRVKWDECNLNSGDCLTPKGFTYMRMTLAEGVELDLYNLHADAGSNDGDLSARAAGIDQILAYMETASAGLPVIVAGDTNDRWTNAGRSIDRLTAAGFSDAWVELVKGGAYPVAGAAADPCDVPADDTQCEIVDKVFFRSGDSVTITATGFEYATDVFVQPDGSILSDHNPVLVDFSWTA